MSRRAGRTAQSQAQRRQLSAVIVILVLALGFHLGGGWYFSSVLEERALSGEARRAALSPGYLVEVLAADGATVTLRAADRATLGREGRFGLTWDGGYGFLGEVTARNGDAVTRAFEFGSGTPLEAGMRADIDRRVFQGDPMTAHGIAFEDVTFPGELGDYPAWYISGERATWFIFVHGNAMTREDALGILPAAVDAGLPVLVPTYRNDPGAPSNPEDRLTYGKEEWRDLENAVDFALANGAESVVLEGLSMGGAVVSAFLAESPLASRVSGVIFDAPLLDFEAAVEFQAEDEEIPLIGSPLPFTLLNAAEYLADRRFGVDWEYTDYLAGGMRTLPRTLLIHGIDDDNVPVATSDALAKLRPEAVVDYWRVPDAGHVEAWNVDSAEYERRVLAFLAAVGALE